MNQAYPEQMPAWATHSDYAQRWLVRFPEWGVALKPNDALVDVVAHTMQPILNGSTNLDEASLMKQLRLARQRLMLEIMRRDLTQATTLFEVTEALSVMADYAIQCALNWAHTEQTKRFGRPAHEDCLMVLGMGKLGGLELNASSDIDLIFVYGEDLETHWHGEEATSNTTTHNAPQKPMRTQSHAEFFTQVGRKIIKLLNDVTEDGFVFRVDMRLRPNGDAGPLAVSLDMLEEYLMVQGREWERYAWIKARITNWTVYSEQDATFIQQTRYLQNLVRPFIYRKYLDFGAIRAVRELHMQIRAEAAKREHNANANIDVKLGRGGIREIEFSAQVFQLIRGGRSPKLQQRRTVDVLAVCHGMGLMPDGELDDWINAYTLLRNIEHRIQYLDDAQTHRVPSDANQLQRVALAMGFPKPSDFLEQLHATRAWVAQRFDALFADKNENSHAATMAQAWPDEWFSKFSDGKAAQSRFKQFHESTRFQSLPLAHRDRIMRIMPALLNSAMQSPAPDASWRFSCELIETIARRGTYLSLLDEYPAARERVCRMLAASPWAAQFLMRHPILLDELLDTRTLLSKPKFDEWAIELLHELQHTRLHNGDADLERQMDLVREQYHAQLFRILAQDLEGMHSIEQISDLISALVDETLGVVLHMAWQELPKRHIEEPRFAVIAYGKLGGKELGYASDLDLIFVYDDMHDEAPELYASLAKRFNRWLCTHTPAGVLFETDYRLRPNGEAGLLVCSLASFEAYQKREGGVGAWFWEHQALSRARFCVGHLAIGQRFEKLREDILSIPRNWAEVREEVLLMRTKMHEGHPNTSNAFNIKHDAGGMVDVEFVVQALVLAHAHRYAALIHNKGNIALLKRMGGLGLLPHQLAEETADAYRQLRAIQHGLRLAGIDHSLSTLPEALQAKAVVQTCWAYLFELNKPSFI